LKLIQGDEHYGEIGFGGVAETTTAVFAVAQADDLMEPTVRIKDVRGQDLLKFDIEDIICWDARKYNALSTKVPNNVGAEDVRQTIHGGITKDNTKGADDQPTSDSTANGTRPGGKNPEVLTLAITTGEEAPRFVERFEWFNGVNEENAAGEITYEYNRLIERQKQGYPLDGNWFHSVLTARHYHLWFKSAAAAAALGAFQLGAEVRKISVELEEVLFDRAAIISLDDAIGVIST